MTSDLASERTQSEASTGTYAGKNSGLADPMPHQDRAVAPLDLDWAISGLRRAAPHFSARTGLSAWQRWAGLAVPLATLLLVWIAPKTAMAMAFAVFALPFFGLTCVRMFALAHHANRQAAASQQAACSGSVATWPTYAVLVPLFRETEVIGRLVTALKALDYPVECLDIVFVLEASDPATPAAIAQHDLPNHMRCVIVPDVLPQTKPKALNVALATTTADFIVIYDAEDRPEPDQLKQAALRFSIDERRRGGRRLACVQARLDIYNAEETFWSRHFAIEYAGLFDVILPALVRVGWPVPLGGTSNHFPRDVLVSVGAWDPFNVTEDADLGIRLARLGFRIETIDSRTFEEAPVLERQWLDQRTRWLKGWLQTCIVHSRSPGKTVRDLGFWSALGLAIYTGGLVGSALVHPWFYVLLLLHAVTGDLWHPAEGITTLVLWWLAGFNLALGYLVAVGLGWRAGRGRSITVWPHVCAMPIYWLMISWAAYRAFWDLWRAPYHWAKTAHGVSRVADRATSAPMT